MISHHPTTRLRRPEECGAVLIEFAAVALLLFVLASAAFDYGIAWRTGLAINEGTRTGARVGSALGAGRSVAPDDTVSYVADHMVLSGVKAALDSSDTIDTLDRLVIFKADSEDGRVPTSCTGDGTPPQSSSCVIISGDVFRNGGWEDDPSAFDANGCLIGAATKDWCPSIRINDQHSADYFGIWIRYRQDHFFGITGSSVWVERQTVMRIEPRVGS